MLDTALEKRHQIQKTKAAFTQNGSNHLKSFRQMDLTIKAKQQVVSHTSPGERSTRRKKGPINQMIKNDFSSQEHPAIASRKSLMTSEQKGRNEKFSTLQLTYCSERHMNLKSGF
ncbi:MAG: hypothetical protein VW124_06935 [Paracoccaceae bacterium]